MENVLKETKGDKVGKGAIVPQSLRRTRPKPVGHGYVFSMAVGTIGEWLKPVPF